MSPKSFHTMILLAGCLSGLQTKAQQSHFIPFLSDSASQADLTSYQEDTVPYVEPAPPARNYSYVVLTVASGLGTVFGRNNNGILNVYFPYSVNGSPGAVFNSGDVQPYASQRMFVLPFGMEVGDKKQFLNVNFAFSVIGQWTRGIDLSLGYGRNYYLGGHSNEPEQKALVLKPSINLCWTADPGKNADANLGTIDNAGNTIQALGYTANPSYTVNNTTYDINGDPVTTTSTNDANTLEVTWEERAFSIVPKLTLSNNQYRKGLHWELTMGYNLPLYERGGISLNQDGSNSVASLIGLNNPGITATYNGSLVTSSPFHFSGFYLSFAFNFSLYKGKVS
jgi:hypothetical protein